MYIYIYSYIYVCVCYAEADISFEEWEGFREGEEEMDEWTKRRERLKRTCN